MYLPLPPGTAPQIAFPKANSGTRAQPSDSGCLGRDVGWPHSSSSPGHQKRSWPLGSTPFALGQREPAAPERGWAAPGSPPLQQGCVPHLRTQHRGSREKTGPGDSLLLPKRLWNLPCTGWQACPCSPPPRLAWRWVDARSKARMLSPRSEESPGAAAAPDETGGTAESWSEGHPAVPLGAVWGRVLAEPRGGGEGSAQCREGVRWGRRGSGCSRKGKGRGVGPSRAGGRTPRFHSPLAPVSKSRRPRGRQGSEVLGAARRKGAETRPSSRGGRRVERSKAAEGPAL